MTNAPAAAPARVALVVLLLSLAVLPAFALVGAPARLWLAALVGALGVGLADRARGAARTGTAESRAGVVLLLVLLVVGAACWPAMGGDFLADDFGYVQLFHRQPLLEALEPREISAGIWGRPLDEFRPLFALTYELGLGLHGVAAHGFLLLNLTLHLLNVALLFALVRRLVPDSLAAAAFAAALFGLQPVHAEPIAWITGKVDALPSVFYLATLWLYVRARQRGALPWVALLSFALGLFSKEILITLPLALVALEALVVPAAETPRTSHRTLALAAFALLAAGFLIVRQMAVHSFARPSTLAGLVAFLSDQPEKLRWQWLPFPAEAQFGPLAAALALGALSVAAFDLWCRGPERTARVAAYGLALYVITLLPLLVTYKSQRHLYLPSAGLALALGVAFFPSGLLRAAWRCRLGLALGLLLGLLPVLRTELAAWAENGRTATLARAQIEDLTRALPDGTLVVLSGLPASDHGRLVFKFALPFALQPPFAQQDLASRFRLLFEPDIFCCPRAAWWQAQRTALQPLLDAPAEEPVELASLHWNPRRGRLVLRRGRPTAVVVRTGLEVALGGSLAGATPPDRAQAERLLAALRVLAQTADAEPDPGN